jgi:hypothetical protein
MAYGVKELEGIPTDAEYDEVIFEFESPSRKLFDASPISPKM